MEERVRSHRALAFRFLSTVFSIAHYSAILSQKAIIAVCALKKERKGKAGGGGRLRFSCNHRKAHARKVRLAFQPLNKTLANFVDMKTSEFLIRQDSG